MFGLKRERTLCVGVVGLGLIGGSMAKALKNTPGTSSTARHRRGDLSEALADGAIDEARRGKRSVDVRPGSFSPSTRSRRSPS